MKRIVLFLVAVGLVALIALPASAGGGRAGLGGGRAVVVEKSDPKPTEIEETIVVELPKVLDVEGKEISLSPVKKQELLLDLYVQTSTLLSADAPFRLRESQEKEVIVTGRIEADKVILTVKGRDLTVHPAFPIALTAGTPYPVKVDYSKSLTEMARAGNFGRIWDDMETTFTMSKGSENLDLYLLKIDRDLSRSRALEALEAQGYRPATVAELIAFATQHSDALKKEIGYNVTVKALGSDGMHWGHRVTPVVRPEENKTLTLGMDNYEYGASMTYDRLLAVKKEVRPPK